MIYTKLLLLEYQVYAGGDKENSRAKLRAIKSLREMLALSEINDENFPANDVQKLSLLLAILKGRKLTEEEIQLVEEIVTTPVGSYNEVL